MSFLKTILYFSPKSRDYEFDDVLSEDLSGKLPPTRDMQYAVDLISGVAFSTCHILG